MSSKASGIFGSATAVTAVFVLLFFHVALAQDETRPSKNMRAPSAKELQERALELSEKRMDLKLDLKSMRENFQNQRADLRTETKAEVKSASSTDEKRTILQSAREERKTLLDARKASTTAQKAQLKALARRHFGLMTQRFNIALRQFDQLAVRIQSRIEKHQANGASTAAAEAALSRAVTTLLEARADVQGVLDIVAQVNDASDPKVVRTQVDEAVKKAMASIKSTHVAFSAAAKVLISVSRPQKVSAPPSATTTPNN